MLEDSNDGSNSSTSSGEDWYLDRPKCLFVAKKPSILQASNLGPPAIAAKVRTIQELVPVLQSIQSSCPSCRSCPFCRDAGAFQYCKIGFRVSSWLLLMTFRTCLEGGGDRTEIQHVDVYSADKDLQTLVELLEELQFPRYSMDNLPEVLLPSLLPGLSRSLKVLEFRDIDLLPSSLHLIQNVLETSKSLQQLHMVGCSFPSIGYVVDDGGRFDHYNFQIDPHCYQVLKEGLQASSSLQVLNMKDCGFSSEGLSAILPTSTATLERLLVGGNACDRNFFRVVGGLLEREDSLLQSLDLSYLTGEMDLEPIAVALASNTTLSELDLGWSHPIPDQGVQRFFESLQVNRTLEKLTLKGFRGQDMAEDLGGMDENGPPSCLTEKGFQMLGSLLPGMGGLRHLDISTNDISLEASKDISRGIRAHTQLQSLSIGDTGAMEPILNAIGSNGSLRSLDLSRTIMNEVSISWLMTALTKNASLRILNTQYCCIDNRCLQIIGPSLPKIRLEEWILDWNDFDLDGTMHFVNGLQENTSLKQVSGMGKVPPASMEYFLKLNRGGRYLVREETPPPASLWAHVLGKAAQCRNVDAIYFFLKQTDVYRFH